MLIDTFLVLIIVGTGLLRLPWATHEPISWLEAAFTATSAVTVTGLTVVDTGVQFTLFGQLVILLLIQLGGLGLMTFAVLTAMVLGFKIGLRHQVLAREALNEISLKSTTRAAYSIAAFAFTVEAVGMLILACFFVPELGWADGLYQAFFYAISGFNSAGFALTADSLASFRSHAGVTLTITALFVIGGLGYLVASEVVQKRRFRTLSVYSKVILTMTLLLNLVAVLAFLGFEYDNVKTLGSIEGWGDKLLAALLQGTAPRSSGFSSVDVGAYTTATSVLFMLLMFIGGAPNSTASGIKITTFVVLLAATRSFLKGSLDVRLFKRSLSRDSVTKALAITTIAMATVFVAIMLLAIAERATLMDIAFEAVSAFGTVGLSRGFTGELSGFSQLVIMVVMVIGRAGPLMLGYMLTVPGKPHVRYARTEFPLG